MNKFFSEIKKNFGFGMMRLPLNEDDVDYETVNKMVDEFIGHGFNYFDTAHVYINGHSEEAIRRCLVERYPRNQYLLANKLSSSCFKTNEDIRPFFEMQLKACGVEYFDFYLMHAQSKRNYDQYQNARAYETALELKKEGKIKHLAISFHDSAEFLDKILTDHPEVEAVQIQYNYLDYDDDNVQSKMCYDVCVKHHKPCIIMEPVRGGRLINLPERGLKLLKDNNISPSSLALRFAASSDNVMMVLSGMSNLEQMNDNLSFMTDFVPLSDKEREIAFEEARIIKEENLIPCTACRYCVEGCPKGILIPDLFMTMNDRKYNAASKRAEDKYQELTLEHGKASACIKCGKCERICPQKLPIRDLLVKVANEFETSD